MSQTKSVLPKLFKGIAVFTPGGDLIYCIDPTKQERWHLNLCIGLQEILELPEPPHFLVPCFSATIDYWLNPPTKQIQTSAEAYPLVMRHQALLNAVFETGDLVWQAAPWCEGFCDPMALASYRSLFAQLWEDHNLIVRYSHSQNKSPLKLESDLVENYLLKTKLHHVCLPEKDSAQPDIKTDLDQQSSLDVNLNLTSAQFSQDQKSHLGYVLRLFVAGHNANTQKILQTLHQILEQSFRHPYTLKVVDVLKHLEQAEADSVSATPTLVKVSPPPIRRLVGDLDHASKILQMLATPD